MATLLPTVVRASLTLAQLLFICSGCAALSNWRGSVFRKQTHDTANTHTFKLPPQSPNVFAASSPPPQSITAAAAAVATDPSQTITAAAAAASATDTHCPPQSPTAVAPTPSTTASLISGEEEMPVDEADNGDQQQQQDEGILQPATTTASISRAHQKGCSCNTAKAKRRQAKNWNKKRRIPGCLDAFLGNEKSESLVTELRNNPKYFEVHT
uniref:Uncharacterized protein n=1 Tax=Globodera rostochiensis TaxID=31243 RepID=A0A914H8E6_GLORO